MPVTPPARPSPDMAEIIQILDRWKESLVEEIAVDALLARCPVAHKWKAPFRCLLVREALLRRMVALGDGIVALTAQSHYLGARVLLRCAVEATALLEYMAQRMDALMAGNITWDRFEELTLKLVVGRRDGEGDIEAVQILNAVRDATRKYEGLEEIHQSLSETVHPNYDGVVGAHAKIDRENHVATFGDFWEERYGRQQVPYTGYIFVVFENCYNRHWVDSMERLEQWFRDHDEELEQSKPSNA